MSQKVDKKPTPEVLHTKIHFQEKLRGRRKKIMLDQDLQISIEFRISSSKVKVGKVNNVFTLANKLNGSEIPKNKQVEVFLFLSPREENSIFKFREVIMVLHKMKKIENLRHTKQRELLKTVKRGQQP